MAEAGMSPERVRDTLRSIMSGQEDDTSIRDFLVELADRGETAPQIAAAVGVLRENAVALPVSTELELCDTCGTGGDGLGTINISTLSALVAAAAGAKVAKHGNRAASSLCGSADVLQALGVNIEAEPQTIARSIEACGFGFCFAARFHPAMKAVAPVRKALGRRTLFNLIGPLANPAALTYQLLGVPDPKLLPVMAEAMQRLGVRRGAVVHGAEGMDELTPYGESRMFEITDGGIKEHRLDAGQLGFAGSSIQALKGGDAQTNASKFRAVLNNEISAMRDAVVFNAGAVLYIAEQAETMEHGLEKAFAAIETGAARRVLDRTIELSHAG